MRTRAGLPIAVGSAALYGTAGSLADPLIRLGWSPAAVALVRLGGAAVVLAVPALLALRHWRPGRAATLRLVAYGVFATGGAQLCYFNAIRYLPVGSASLLEFTGPIWLLGWFWVRDRHRPSKALALSALLALAGLVLVLGPEPNGFDLPGLAWGLGSAFCLCAYLLLSDDHASAAPPVVTAGAGMLIGALAVGVVGVTGLLPLRVTGGTTELGSVRMSWLLPATAVVLVPTVFAYLAGIVAVRRLGSSRASFVALAEVIFVVLSGALLLAQWPHAIQLAGIGLVVAGIAIAQRSGSSASRRTPEPGLPCRRPGRVDTAA